MRIILIICLALNFSLSSCSIDDTEKEALTEIYVESFPVEGRMELQFLQDNMIIITKDGGTRDKFKYELKDNIIIFIPLWDPTISTEHDFDQLKSNKIQIGNMLPRFPESPDIPVVFVKN